jgi:hypothetical protein
LFEIPEKLNPQLAPLGKILKDDSNNGIDEDWTKVFFHIYKENAGLLNLPRVVYAKKSWTLMELHYQFFDYIKDLLRKWLKDVQENGSSDKNSQEPKYKHKGEALTYDLFETLSNEEQFQAFFPNLTQDSWKEDLGKRCFNLEDMPYQLKI